MVGGLDTGGVEARGRAVLLSPCGQEKSVTILNSQERFKPKTE